MTSKQTWISVPITEEEKARVDKAASRADLSRSSFVRDRLFSAMRANDEWSIPGPRKGST